MQRVALIVSYSSDLGLHDILSFTSKNSERLLTHPFGIQPDFLFSCLGKIFIVKTKYSVYKYLSSCTIAL